MWGVRCVCVRTCACTRVWAACTGFLFISLSISHTHTSLPVDILLKDDFKVAVQKVLGTLSGLCASARGRDHEFVVSILSRVYSITHSEEFKRHPFYKPDRPRYYEICVQLKPGVPLPTQNEALRLINALVQLPPRIEQRLNVRAQLGQVRVPHLAPPPRLTSSPLPSPLLASPSLLPPHLNPPPSP